LEAGTGSDLGVFVGIEYDFKSFLELSPDGRRVVFVAPNGQRFRFLTPWEGDEVAAASVTLLQGWRGLVE